MNPHARALALDLLTLIDAAERNPAAGARIEQATRRLLGHHHQLLASDKAHQS